MAAGYQALTEKEKETLRLLLGGHDAKSIARYLGLSVHTIHERLRDARRKMSVSSSREAARQLREIEGQAAESFGDKPLGDAAPHGVEHRVRRPARSYGEWRRTGWIVGGLFMTIALALLALSTLSGSGETTAIPASAVGAVAPTSASEAAAVSAARQFLGMVDREDWSGSWQATHRSFQLLNTVDWWAQTSQKVRGAIGTPGTRELATVDFTAAPPNGYWVVKFKTQYSKRGLATETLQMASEAGGWKVAGITIE